MKITKMRINGKVLTAVQMAMIQNELAVEIYKAGFLTSISKVNASHLRLGLHMCSFKVDTTIHGHNVRHNPSLGQRRTSTPTWAQRVEYNNIVNAVLDSFNVSANVKSGPFTIRQGNEAMNQSDWLNQKPDWMSQNETRGWYVEAA
jgi:hypothetical protein